MDATDNSFGGDVSASAGGSGIGGGNAGGSNGLGAGDGGGGGGNSTSAESMGLGSMATAGGSPETTMQDLGLLGAIASAGLSSFLGSGAPAAATAAIGVISAAYGANPTTALGHLGHDAAMGFNSSVGDNGAIFGGPQ